VKLSSASQPDEIDKLMGTAKKAHTAKEANATIDALGEYGAQAEYAINEVIQDTIFDEVRLHGLEVVRRIKSSDTQF
jgi:hypothetical protein